MVRGWGETESNGRHELCDGGWEGQSEGESVEPGMGGECGGQ